MGRRDARTRRDEKDDTWRSQREMRNIRKMSDERMYKGEMREMNESERWAAQNVAEA